MQNAATFLKNLLSLWSSHSLPVPTTFEEQQKKNTGVVFWKKNNKKKTTDAKCRWKKEMAETNKKNQSIGSSHGVETWCSFYFQFHWYANGIKRELPPTYLQIEYYQSKITMTKRFRKSKYTRCIICSKVFGQTYLDEN